MKEERCKNHILRHTHIVPENTYCSTCFISVRGILGAKYCPYCGLFQCRSCNLKNCAAYHPLEKNTNSIYHVCSLCQIVSQSIMSCSQCNINYCKDCKNKKYKIGAFFNISCTDENFDETFKASQCLACKQKIPFKSLVFECKDCLDFICLNCIREEHVQKLSRMLRFMGMTPTLSILNVRVLHCPHLSLTHVHQFSEPSKRCFCCKNYFFKNEGFLSMFRCSQCREYFCNQCGRSKHHTSLDIKKKDPPTDAVVCFRKKLGLKNYQCPEKRIDTRITINLDEFLHLCVFFKGFPFPCIQCFNYIKNNSFFWKCKICNIYFLCSKCKPPVVISKIFRSFNFCSNNACLRGVPSLYLKTIILFAKEGMQFKKIFLSDSMSASYEKFLYLISIPGLKSAYCKDLVMANYKTQKISNSIRSIILDLDNNASQSQKLGLLLNCCPTLKKLHLTYNRFFRKKYFQFNFVKIMDVVSQYTNIKKLTFEIFTPDYYFWQSLTKMLQTFDHVFSLSLIVTIPGLGPYHQELERGIRNAKFLKRLKLPFLDIISAENLFELLKSISHNRAIKKVSFVDRNHEVIPFCPLIPAILFAVTTNPPGRVIDFGRKKMGLATHFFKKTGGNVFLDKCCCTLLGPENLIARGDCLCVDLCELTCISAGIAINTISYFKATKGKLMGNELGKELLLKDIKNNFNSLCNLFPLYIDEAHWKIAKTKLPLLYPDIYKEEILRYVFSAIRLHKLNGSFLPLFTDICMALCRENPEIVQKILDPMLSAIEQKSLSLPKKKTEFYFLLKILNLEKRLPIEKSYILIGKCLKDKYMSRFFTKIPCNRRDIKTLEIFKNSLKEIKVLKIEEVKKYLLNQEKNTHSIHLSNSNIVSSLKKSIKKLERFFERLPPYNCYSQIGIENDLEAGLLEINSFMKKENRALLTLESLPHFILKTLKRQQALENKAIKQEIKIQKFIEAPTPEEAIAAATELNHTKNIWKKMSKKEKIALFKLKSTILLEAKYNSTIFNFGPSSPSINTEFLLRHKYKTKTEFSEEEWKNLFF